jgi:hypothetical protein
MLLQEGSLGLEAAVQYINGELKVLDVRAGLVYG